MRRVHELVEGGRVARRRDRPWRSTEGVRVARGTRRKRVLVSPNACTSVISEQVQRGQQRASHGLVAEFLAVQLDAGLNEFRAMLERLIYQVLGRLDRFALRNRHR